MRNCTVMGGIETHSVGLAENTIFLGEVHVASKMQGCMRFCYVPKNRELHAVTIASRISWSRPLMQEARQQGLSAADAEVLKRAEGMRVRPQFLSSHLRHPELLSSRRIVRCRDYQWRRRSVGDGRLSRSLSTAACANLRARLSDYTPAGSNVGIIFVT